MRVLIVDDDPVSRMLLGRMLRNDGHEVVEASDGNAALTHFKTALPPLVVADWEMPGLDGIELCRQIRRCPAGHYVYVILLTARQGAANYMHAMEAGADDFISKPLDAEYLRTRVRVAQRILELHSEVRELRGLLPICSYCKKIRSDDGVWTRLEQYICDHSEAAFTHGICQDCLKKQLDELE